MGRKQRSYDFPAARIVIRADGQCRQIPHFCPSLSVEVSRTEVAQALLELRARRNHARRLATAYQENTNHAG